MMYFKTTFFPGIREDVLELAIRKYAAKRHTSLDWQPSSVYMSEEKAFLGLEGMNGIQITRLRTPFERILPKLIFMFPKVDNFRSCKVRLSVLPAVIFLLLVFSFVTNLIYLFIDDGAGTDFVTIVFALGIFLFLTYIDYKVTINRIRWSVKRTSVNLISEVKA